MVNEIDHQTYSDNRHVMKIASHKNNILTIMKYNQGYLSINDNYYNVKIIDKYDINPLIEGEN
jgi:hypothetical protein